MKDYRVEVTHVAVTCWVFAGFGDLAVLVAMRMQRENLAIITIFVSSLLAFIGFRNVREYYTYLAQRYYSNGHRLYCIGAYQAEGSTHWDFWFALGMLHMWIMGLPIGIVGLTSLWSNIIQKFPVMGVQIPELPSNVLLLIITGTLFALMAMIIVWRMGILEKPKTDGCWMCSTSVLYDANYCQHCGVRLYRCKHCGQLHKPTANYCSKCSQKLEAHHE